jgi:hypothetical protein
VSVGRTESPSHDSSVGTSSLFSLGEQLRAETDAFVPETQTRLTYLARKRQICQSMH